MKQFISLEDALYKRQSIRTYDMNGLSQAELKEIEDYLKELEKCNVDAIIVSDPTIVDIALNKTKLKVHLSTQTSTINIESCKFW